MGIDFKTIASDWLLPAAGALVGYGYGGASGAGIGAGAGRFAGGYLKKEDTSHQVKNAALAGALAYGGANAYDKWGGGGGAYFGSPGAVSSSGSPGTSPGGGGSLGGGTGWTSSPYTLMGMSALANALSAAEQGKNANDIYNQQMENWRNTAFPNAATVDAQTASAASGINQQSMLARQRLYDQMAARGIGAGSGVLSGVAAEEDRARRQRLAALASNMIQFKNTPMYAPPTYQGTSTTPVGSLAGNLGSSAGLAAGLALQQSYSDRGPNYQNEYYRRLLGNGG